MKCNYKPIKPMSEKDKEQLSYALRNHIFRKMVEGEKEHDMEKVEEAEQAYELLKIFNKAMEFI